MNILIIIAYLVCWVLTYLILRESEKKDWDQGYRVMAIVIGSTGPVGFIASIFIYFISKGMNKPAKW